MNGRQINKYIGRQVGGQIDENSRKREEGDMVGRWIYEIQKMDRYIYRERWMIGRQIRHKDKQI